MKNGAERNAGDKGLLLEHSLIESNSREIFEVVFSLYEH